MRLTCSQFTVIVCSTCFFFLIFPIFPFLFQIVFYTFFGWIWGLFRFTQGLFHEPNAVLLALVGVLLLPLTFHLFVAPLAKRYNRNWSWRKSFAGSWGLLLIAVAGIALAAGFHDFLWLIQPSESILGANLEPARRMQSSTRLKEISNNTNSFRDTYNAFPFGGTILEDGRLGHSWMTQLLPFCELTEFYEKIDLTLPWNDPINQPVFKESIRTYSSPYLQIIEQDIPPEPNGFARTDYSANQFVMPVGRSLKTMDIQDGTSNTVLAGEVVHQLPAWGSPLNGRDLRLGINSSQAGFGSKHPHGLCVGFCDGSTRFLSQSTDLKILEALASPNGGEIIPEL